MVNGKLYLVSLHRKLRGPRIAGRTKISATEGILEMLYTRGICDITDELQDHEEAYKFVGQPVTDCVSLVGPE